MEAAVSEKCLRVLVDSVSPEGMVVVNVEDQSLVAMFTPGDERVLAVAESEDGYHLARVDGLRRADCDSHAAQRLDELHQMPGNPMWRKGLRRSSASDGN